MSESLDRIADARRKAQRVKFRLRQIYDVSGDQEATLCNVADALTDLMHLGVLDEDTARDIVERAIDAYESEANP